MATRRHRVQEERSFPGRHRVSQYVGKTSHNECIKELQLHIKNNNRRSKIVSSTVADPGSWGAPTPEFEPKTCCLTKILQKTA